LIRHILRKISPNPSFSKRGIPPFRKGREEGFNLQRPYNYGLISNSNYQNSAVIAIPIPRFTISIGADMSISTAVTPVLHGSGWHERLLWGNDLSQQAEDDMIEVAKSLIELSFVFKKRQFDGGIDSCPSEEQKDAIDPLGFFSSGLRIDGQVEWKLKRSYGLAPVLPIFPIEFFIIDAQVFLIG